MSVREFRSRPLGKYFGIRSRLKTDLVLEVKDGTDKPGTSVVINEEAPSTASQDHQLWYYDSETATIRSKINQFCLDITEKDSELVVQPHLSQASSQKWIFYEDKIQTEEDFEMVVSVTDIRLQSPLKVQPNDDSSMGQRWSFDCKPAPFFYIRSYQTTKVLDVRGADPKPGTKLIIYEAKGDMAENQLWYEDQNGIIRSKLNSFAIDASGKDVVLMPYEKSKEWQQWIVNGNSIQNRVSSRNVLELKSAKFRSDATVFLAEQTIFNPMQFWTFDQVSDSSATNHSGNGKHFIIRSRLAGLVLETKDRLASAGSLVVTGFREEHGSRTSANQLFFVDEVTGTIRTSVNNYCLDLTDGDDGHSILNPYDPYRKTQQWRITGKKIFCRQHADLILTLNPGDAKQPGITVSARKDENADSQLWDITHQPAKCFFLTSQMNGKVLDVKSSDPSPGTKVIMYDRKTELANNQLWYEDENGVLRSKLNGFVMEAPTEKSESIRLKPFNPTNNNHYWIIVGDRIQNKYDNGVVLDIRGENKKNRASLCAYKFTGGENQRWTLEYVV